MRSRVGSDEVSGDHIGATRSPLSLRLFALLDLGEGPIQVPPGTKPPGPTAANTTPVHSDHLIGDSTRREGLHVI